MPTINYDHLWTRAIGPREVTQVALDKYGDKLTWGKGRRDALHDTCVDGYLTRNVIYPFIEKHIKTMLGVDRWPDIIDFANKENATDKLSYQVFDIMNATDDQIDKMENRFDHIFSIFVAEWLVPNWKLLERYNRLLIPGGQIFMVILPDTPMHQSYYKMSKEAKWKDLITGKQIFVDYTDDPVGYFVPLLTTTGFKTDVCEVSETSMTLDNLTEYINLVSIMYYNFWDKLSPQQQKEFLKENMEHILEMVTYLGEPDMYDFPYTGLTVVATKRNDCKGSN